ncbi:unnamed protein product [Diabrotica balteata]|uniref:Uncharacterized protein n=1 Tax=Diabrotica balteata TaxID=107213 RepID=A0A9N9XGX3_DIABA|nr:unnamed protein product [Diabrotica balteata]
MDENIAAEATQEEIFENIKLHKEVLSNVRMQPWNMRKKLKLVIQAKAYIKKHEGVLQERLAQSRSTKDWLARWRILLIKRLYWSSSYGALSLRSLAITFAHLILFVAALNSSMEVMFVHCRMFSSQELRLLPGPLLLLTLPSIISWSSSYF